MRGRLFPFQGPRLIFLTIVMLFTFGVLIFRLYEFQVVRYSEFESLSEDNAIQNVPLPSPRGVIYDRYGRPLALNAAAFNVSIIPAEVPDEYTARSPLFFAAAFPTVPLMIIHGTADYFVPHKHSCLLRDALVSAGAAFTNIHIENTSGMGNVITDQVPTCTTATYAPTWPTTFSGDHYLIILDGQGHGFVGAGAARAAEAANSFLVEHVK